MADLDLLLGAVFVAAVAVGQLRAAWWALKLMREPVRFRKG